MPSCTIARLLVLFHLPVLWIFSASAHKPRGLRLLEDNSKIIKGEPAQSGEFLYFVGLHVKGKYDYCGEAIVSPLWIFTARHCIMGYGLLYDHTPIWLKLHKDTILDERCQKVQSLSCENPARAQKFWKNSLFSPVLTLPTRWRDFCRKWQRNEWSKVASRSRACRRAIENGFQQWFACSRLLNLSKS